VTAVTPSCPRILYVEDSAADADLMRRALEAAGKPFSLTVLNDGQAALDLVRSGSPPLPDVIVLDVKLRAVDGLTVLAEMKSNTRWQKIPVLVFAAPQDPNALQATKLAADLCCAKPMDWSGWPGLAESVRGLSLRSDKNRAIS
jgi:two-component system response regulator